MDKNISDYISEITKSIVMSVEETESNFIFTTIQPFVQQIAGIEVSKDELAKAILLYRNLKENNITIEECLEGANQREEVLKEVYERGVKDGIAQEMKAVYFR